MYSSCVKIGRDLRTGNIKTLLMHSLIFWAKHFPQLSSWIENNLQWFKNRQTDRRLRPGVEFLQTKNHPKLRLLRNYLKNKEATIMDLMPVSKSILMITFVIWLSNWIKDKMQQFFIGHMFSYTFINKPTLVQRSSSSEKFREVPPLPGTGRSHRSR